MFTSPRARMRAVPAFLRHLASLHTPASGQCRRDQRQADARWYRRNLHGWELRPEPLAVQALRLDRVGIDHAIAAFGW